MTRRGDRARLPEVHRLVSAIDYPMYIVTVAAGGHRAGCLVGFTTQCSIDPPRFLVCISVVNHTFAVARGADAMVVHLVPEEASGLAELFGGRTGDEVDKFAQCDWTPGPEGVPALDGCPDWFAGRVLERLPVGDHWAFLLDPFAGESAPHPDAFTFHRARRIPPGHPA
jgi:flavin reductase (DIM6/NTAB) family NADH-FMN oxidoreductase RutF